METTENRCEQRGALVQQGVYHSVSRCRGSKRIDRNTIEIEIKSSWGATETSFLWKLRQLKADVYPGIKAYTHAQRRHIPRNSSYFSNVQISTKFTRHIKKHENMAQCKKQNKSPDTNPKEIQISQLPRKEF